MLVFWGAVSQLVMRTVDVRFIVAWRRRLVKYISWYFLGANVAPYWLAYVV